MTEIIPIKPGNLPAAPDAAVRFAAYRTLADAADGLRSRLEELRSLRRAYKFTEPLPDIADVELSAEERAAVVNANKLFDVLEAREHYDDTFTLRRDVIKRRLAVMLDAIPAGDQKTEGTIRMMLNHVADVPHLRYVELEGACRELEKTKTFSPSIAEVLQAIYEQQEIWAERRAGLRIDREAAEMADKLAKLRPKWEAAARQREIERAEIARNSALHDLDRTRTQLVADQQRAAEAAQHVADGLARLQQYEAAAEAAALKLAEVEAGPAGRRRVP